MPKMEVTETIRGFKLIKFFDSNWVSCSLQKSGLGGKIWLGCNDAEPRVIVPGKGWMPIEMPSDYIANTRMHLSREQVAELLPHLQRFVESGDL